MLEIVIAAAVLAVALVPIIGSIGASTSESRLLLYHSQALLRARGLLQAAAVWGPEVFERHLKSQNKVKFPLKVSDCPQPGTGPETAGKDSLLSRMGRPDESVEVERVRAHGRNGLYLLTSRVSWTLAADPRHAHTIELSTLVGSPLVTVNDGGGGR